MSRCFPYPPPGYTLSRAQNLIELIKLQKEKERKKEKKEKRKEKKEKRKEKKENQGSLLCQRSLSEKKEKEFLCEKREVETEQFEKSSVTEEHACPSSLSVPSTSCDSTQNNNNKRKKHSSPGHGTVCLTSQKIEGKSEIKPVPEANLTSMQKMDLQYKNLLDCIPKQIQDACHSSEDLDWLFQGRNQEAHAEKKRRFRSESLSCSRSFSGLLWPRAEYLREVDIFALPYTVPF